MLVDFYHIPVDQARRQKRAPDGNGELVQFSLMNNCTSAIIMQDGGTLVEVYISQVVLVPEAE